MGNYNGKTGEGDIKSPQFQRQSSNIDQDMTQDIKFCKSPLTNRNRNLSITVASKKIFQDQKIQQKSEQSLKNQAVDEKKGIKKESAPNNEEQIEELMNVNLFKTYEQVFQKKSTIKKKAFQKMKIDPQQFIVMKHNMIHQDYTFYQEIGCGGFGCSYVCIDNKNQEKRAIKRIPKENLDQYEFQSLMNQFQILKKMDHPNIIKLYEVYNDESYLYFVMELCQGGSLLGLINSYTLNQEVIRVIMIQLLSATSYMHSRKILHKDLKFENIVIVDKCEKKNLQKIQIKVIDFGLSIDLSSHTLVTDQDLGGTLIYQPPQSFSGIVQQPWDIWSCGVICYAMSTGVFPYKKSRPKQALLQSIQKGNINRKPLQKLSKNHKRFIMTLLQKEPRFRSTADQALKDEWIKESLQKNQITRKARKKTIFQLKKKKESNILISFVESYLVSKKLTQKERQKFGSIFGAIDKNKNGVLQKEEIQSLFLQSSQQQKAQIQKIMSILDKNNSGKVDFTEFMAILCKKRQLFKQSNLRQIFDFLNIHQVVNLRKQDLYQALKGESKQEIDQIFNTIDQNKDGKISQEEFITYFQSLIEE